MEINYNSIKDRNFVIIDLRDNEDFGKKHLDGSVNIPFIKLIIDYEKYLSKEEDYLLVCDRGIKSKKTCAFLNKRGYHTFSLKGGIKYLFTK